MKLHDWWLKSFDKAWDRMPPLVQIIVILWVLIGLLVAVVPELQQMPDAMRFAIGLPAALGILWIGTGAMLAIADKLVGLAAFIRRKMTRTAH